MAALFVDQLTVIDFAYFDPERGIVGESWIVDVLLEGELDEQGMVFDFGDVKKQIKIAIDNSVDHKLVVPALYAGFNLTQNGEQLELNIIDSNQRSYQHISPQEAVVLINAEQVSMQAVEALLIQECQKVVPENVTKISLTLSTESIDGAYYHYAHGLKKHLGDCQRIAHGHRSKIEIYENDQRSIKLENVWAKKWTDIYIATLEDLNNQIIKDGVEYFEFSYQSEQGEFSLIIPKDRCHLMRNDSTVELIAAHIAKQLKKVRPDSEIKVKAFEGVNKGAIASA